MQNNRLWAVSMGLGPFFLPTSGVSGGLKVEIFEFSFKGFEVQG